MAASSCLSGTTFALPHSPRRRAERSRPISTPETGLTLFAAADVDTPLVQYAASPETVLHRAVTVALVRRHFYISMQLGRLPSVIGREFFPSRATVRQVHTFEDWVIFAHDMEQCLEHLDSFQRELIGRIVIQEYGQEEAARLMNVSLRTVERRFPEALDRLTQMLLDKLLIPRWTEWTEEACQEAKNVTFAISNT